MNQQEIKHVLITGATSGLGKALSEQFLQHGCRVTGIARTIPQSFKNEDGFHFVPCDFSLMKNVAQTFEDNLSGADAFDLVICNAGMLSPPEYTLSRDGYEISCQVNFLAQVLLTKLLLKKKQINGPVVNTSSPVFKRGQLSGINIKPQDYHWFQAYSNTKLYMALWAEKLNLAGVDSFAFDPGTFRSGIYRSQSSWFQNMYHIAAPFMVSSRKVADCLFKIIDRQKWVGGQVMSKKGKAKPWPSISTSEKDAFWSMVESQLNKYL